MLICTSKSKELLIVHTNIDKIESVKTEVPKQLKLMRSVSKSAIKLNDIAANVRIKCFHVLNLNNHTKNTCNKLKVRKNDPIIT